MFALIRHATYDNCTGSLTEDGVLGAKRFATMLKERGETWKEIHTSPSTRTRMTAEIIGEILGIPIKLDDRLGMEGRVVDLLPPSEPHGNIFITHLPILTRMLRAWSHIFHTDEPPMVDICSGYLVDTEHEKLIQVHAYEGTSRST